MTWTSTIDTDFKVLKLVVSQCSAMEQTVNTKDQTLRSVIYNVCILVAFGLSLEGLSTYIKKKNELSF